MAAAGTSSVLHLADVVRRLKRERDNTSQKALELVPNAGSSGSVPLLRPAAQVTRWLGTHRRAASFACCCLFVALVSVHDAMLVVVNHQVIHEVEQNPVGRWLIEMQGGDVWLFVLTKLTGTAIVCTVLVTLYEAKAHLASIAAGALACFQLVLLCYLTFA